MKPVPTMFDPKKVINKNSEITMLPHQFVFLGEHRGNVYIKKINMNHLSPRTLLNESFPPSGYTFRKNDDLVLFYKLEENEMSIPEVTDCIRIDSELHVQPFFKGASVPLPQWLRHGRDCRLSRKSMLKNFPAYLQSRKELYSSVFEELHHTRT